MTINIYVILGIIVIHWIADFVFQTDWQAKNKSKNNEALVRHTLTYSLTWLLITLLYCIVHPPCTLFLFFAPITFVCHTAQDYYTSRTNSRLWSQGRVHDFFVSVGFDQVLHYTQLYLTWLLLTEWAV